jgi:hypothetical protein
MRDEFLASLLASSFFTVGTMVHFLNKSSYEAEARIVKFLGHLRAETAAKTAKPTRLTVNNPRA